MIVGFNAGASLSGSKTSEWIMTESVLRKPRGMDCHRTTSYFATYLAMARKKPEGVNNSDRQLGT